MNHKSKLTEKSCEPGSQKFGSQKSGSKKFGLRSIFKYFYSNNSEPWFTNYPSAIFKIILFFFALNWLQTQILHFEKKALSRKKNGNTDAQYFFSSGKVEILEKYKKIFNF